MRANAQALRGGTWLLIEGRPGAGKTTAARRLVGILRGGGVPVQGFICTSAGRG